MADSEVAICNLALLKTGDSGGLIDTLDDQSQQAVVLKLLYAQKRDELMRSFKWPWAQRRAYPTQLGGGTWAIGTTYNAGDYVSYAPSISNVTNPPELVSTFVYLSLAGNNLGNAPDSSPGSWRQISRAAWAYCFLYPGDVLQLHGLYHGIRNAREDQEVPYELGYEPAPGPGTILFTDAGLPYEILSQGTSPASIEIRYTAQVTDTKQFPPDFTDALAWMVAEQICLALRKDAAEATRCAAAGKIAKGLAYAAAKQSIRPGPEPMPSWLAARFTRRRGHR